MDDHELWTGKDLEGGLFETITLQSPKGTEGIQGTAKPKYSLTRPGLDRIPHNYKWKSLPPHRPGQWVPKDEVAA